MLTCFLKKMRKLGYQKKASQGLEEFAQTVRDEKIRHSALVFTRCFHEIYFRDKVFTKSDIRNLRRMIFSID